MYTAGHTTATAYTIHTTHRHTVTRAGNEPSQSLKFHSTDKVPTPSSNFTKDHFAALQHAVTLLRQNCPACDRLVTGGQPGWWALGGTGSWVFVEF